MKSLKVEFNGIHLIKGVSKCLAIDFPLQTNKTLKFIVKAEDRENKLNIFISLKDPNNEYANYSLKSKIMTIMNAKQKRIYNNNTFTSEFSCNYVAKGRQTQNKLKFIKSGVRPMKRMSKFSKSLFIK